ncbi:MAG: triose-phosphate isomerase, partial [Candidatus Omnitrophica bacterium]|nr:triose-phosphate isomerase [Candidatus Omnitrophota bacterium]
EHIKEGFIGIGPEEVIRLVIAYEPVWAIGTGKTATPQQAQEAQKYIRDLLTEMYNKEYANLVRILYGGSVKPENITELMQQPDVDGVLVGGASLSIESFTAIVKKASEVNK